MSGCSCVSTFGWQIIGLKEPWKHLVHPPSPSQAHYKCIPLVRLACSRPNISNTSTTTATCVPTNLYLDRGCPCGSKLPNAYVPHGCLRTLEPHAPAPACSDCSCWLRSNILIFGGAGAQDTSLFAGGTGWWLVAVPGYRAAAQPAVLVGPVSARPQDRRKPVGQSRGWSTLLTVRTPSSNSTLSASRGRLEKAFTPVGSLAEMLCTHATRSDLGSEFGVVLAWAGSVR